MELTMFESTHEIARRHLVNKWVILRHHPDPEKIFEKVKIVDVKYNPSKVTIAFKDGKTEFVNFDQLEAIKIISKRDYEYFCGELAKKKGEWSSISNMTDGDKKSWIYNNYKSFLNAEEWDAIAKAQEFQQLSFHDFEDIVKKAISDKIPPERKAV